MCKSHKNKLLKEHLEEVRFLCSILDDSDVLKNAAYFHDIGKAIECFQRRLDNKEGGECWSKFNIKEHALPSAIFFIKNFGLDKKNLLTAWLIASHHSGLIRGVKNFTKTMKGDLEEKMEDVNKIESKKCVNQILEGFELKAIDSIEVFDEYRKIVSGLVTSGKDEIIDLYVNQNTLLSYLIISDRLSAATLYDPKGEILNNILDNKIKLERKSEEYWEEINKLLEKEMSEEIKNKEVNSWRRKIQKSILNEYEKGKSVYLINVPTGGGKTIGAFLLALKIAKNENKKRIIYALPYVSIIDQTEKVIKNLNEKIFENKLRIKTAHYLSKLDEKEEEDEKVLYETIGDLWNFDVIITTYVKVWDMLIVFNKRGNINLPFIRDSVIILDEIQYIPYGYKLLFIKALNNLVKKYNCNLIITTATSHLEEKDFEDAKITPKEKVNVINVRTKIVPFKEKIDYSNLVELIRESKKNNKKILVVLNTIKSSLKLFNDFYEMNNKNLFYLSSIVIPAFRNEILDRFQNEGGILISTQSVEAGVDIDCDVAFREIAPLDSIIQIAGRVNRNGKKGIKEVYVFETEESENSFSGSVYSKHQYAATKDVLDHEIEESDYSESLERYLKNLYEKTEKPNVKMNKYIKVLKFLLQGEDKNLNEFELIKERGDIKITYVFPEIRKDFERLEKIKKEINEVEYEEKMGLVKELTKIKTKLDRYSVEYRKDELGLTKEEDQRFLFPGDSEWGKLYDERIKGLKLFPDTII